MRPDPRTLEEEEESWFDNDDDDDDDDDDDEEQNGQDAEFPSEKSALNDGDFKSYTNFKRKNEEKIQNDLLQAASANKVCVSFDIFYITNLKFSQCNSAHDELRFLTPFFKFQGLDFLKN